MKKKILKLLFLIAFIPLIWFPLNVGAEDNYEGLKLIVDPVTSLNAGDTVKLRIVTDGDPIGSLDAYIKYDLSIFEEITEDDIECKAQRWRVDNIDFVEEYYGANTGYLILANSKGQAEATGEIATITLTLKKAITQTTLTLSDIYVVIDGDISLKVLDNITAEIRLAYKYDITYNGNTTDTVTGIPSNDTKIENVDYTIAGTPTRQNYTFKEWNTAADGSGTSYSVGQTYSINENLTLYAQWEANKYTITFNPGEGASSEEQTKEVIYGEKYDSLPIPTKPGHKFDGWYDSDGNLITKDNTVDISSDTTLTAKWVANEYQLIFEYNGGTGNITSKTIKYGEQYGELPQATKENHTFLGWYDENGNKVESTNTVNTESDITIYAKYKEEAQIVTHIVTFKNDDGTEIKSIEVEHGKEATFTGTLPEKQGVAAGYQATFAGWDNEEAMKNVIQDITLTAIYEIKPIVYTITYYNVKDADNSSNPTQYTVEDNNFNLTDLSNQGSYIFKGWYTSNEENAEKVTSIDTSKLENIVLYAQWENDKLYLSSEIYKIGDDDIKNYNDGDKYISRVKHKTTKTEFINYLNTNGTVSILKHDGTELKDDEFVGTGMTLEVTKDDENISLKIAVMGDLTGEGEVTATDLSALNQQILKLITLENEYHIAADLDENDKITATDLSTEKHIVLKLI